MPFFLPQTRLLTALLLLTTIAATRAGTVRGTVTGADGKGLPFANVAVRGTATSTGSNEQGQYQLRLPAGTCQLAFQYVGYRRRIEVVRVPAGDSTLTLNVALVPEAYNLAEVTVRGSDRDPAYAIMQHAQQWRACHLREVAAFRARLYIKSLIRLSDTPSKVLGLFKVGPDIKPGILYLAESLSEIDFRQPNTLKQRMLSGRVSGNARGIPIEQASTGASLNFYENLIKAPFGGKGFVSPIAAGALGYYTYALVGTSQQGGETVHKIRVEPKQRNAPAFSGFVYIVDGSWRLHSLELRLSKDAQLDYVDELRVEQLFAPAPGAPHVWLTQSQRATFSFSAFGFKGSGYFNGILSDYSRVVPTYPPSAMSKEQSARNNQKPEIKNQKPETSSPDIAPVTTKELTQQIKRERPNLSGLARRVRRRVQAAQSDSARQGAAVAALDPLSQMKRGQVQLVEKSVNERDTAYWATVRPVPLTAEEKVDYFKKDSSEVKRRSRPYQDSVDRQRNKLSADKLLLSGYRYSRTFLKQSWFVPPIFNEVLYNTVEGYVLNAQATYVRRTDDRRFLVLTPTLRYGLQNEQLQPSLGLRWQLDPVLLRQVGLSAGRTIENFDRNSQLTPFINTAYSLLANQNFAKLYRRDGAELNYLFEPVNGLTVRGAASYFERVELRNTSTYLLRDVPGRAFTPNQPLAEEAPAGTGFGRSRALTFALNLSFKPGQRYISRPDGKFNLGSKWPTLTAQARLAVPNVLGSEVRYALLQAGVEHTLPLGLAGTSSFQATVGGFVGPQQGLTFVDFRHFSGNRTLLAANFEQFQLLDYYQYSTRASYFEGHYNHHFNGFLFNRLPLLRNLKWQEVVSLHYLRTAQAGHYVELGAGIEHIFKLARVDFYTGLQSGQRVGTGIRIGIGI